MFKQKWWKNLCSWDTNHQVAMVMVFLLWSTSTDWSTDHLLLWQISFDQKNFLLVWFSQLTDDIAGTPDGITVKTDDITITPWCWSGHQQLPGPLLLFLAPPAPQVSACDQMPWNLWRRGWWETVWATESAWPCPYPEENHKRRRRRWRRWRSEYSTRSNHALFGNLKKKTSSFCPSLPHLF